ncbi:MAG: arginine deiminase [Anaerovoracaceae bacterium]|nr:arginine deiminase [Bacillota bacterium]MEE0516833.1 arginine deiminase [Anaerovoracaceae bacterium]
MDRGIHNYSEIGKLEKVLLHRPGREIEALTPSTMERLLFDDVPYLKEAQKEHDAFAKVLKDNGTEVIYYRRETAKALHDDKVKEAFIDDMISLSFIESDGTREAIKAFLMSLAAEDMVEKIIEGVKRKDLGKLRTGSLSDLTKADYPYVMDPMPNLYFTRDPGACIGNGINIHHMHTPARRRESLLLKYMFEYSPDFASDENKKFYDIYDDYSLEGGDILVLSKDVVAVGYSERTTIAGIENFAENLLKNSEFKKVIVFDIPKCRAFMHLDTVFTMVDYDKFTIHSEIEGSLSVYELTAGKGGKLSFKSIRGALDKILAKELRLPAAELIRCGGGDMMAAQREQWNDGSNTLCIEPGTVVTYERNYVTNDLLDKHGIKVLTIPSAELSRGRGGPRCMSCPVSRCDLQ